MPSPDLAVGVGFRPGTSAADIVDAISATIPAGNIRRLATLDRRASEPGFLDAAARLEAEPIGFPAEELSRRTAPNPSPVVAAITGTASVAESAALLASNGGKLILPKTKVSGIILAAATIN